MKRSKILLVEDEPDLRRTLVEFLANQLYEVSVAEDVQTALEKLSAASGYDLAVVDFWLGAESAISVLDQINRNEPAFPIIVISGGNKMMDLETTQAIADVSGAVTFLQKPFGKATFIGCVESALKT